MSASSAVLLFGLVAVLFFAGSGGRDVPNSARRAALPLLVLATILVATVFGTNLIKEGFAAPQSRQEVPPPFPEAAERCGTLDERCEVVSAGAAVSSAQAAWLAAYATLAGTIVAFGGLVAAIVGAVIAFRVGIGQINATRAVNAVDHTLRLAATWNNDDYLKKRSSLARHLMKDSTDMSSIEAWQVATFFESVGRLLKLGALNQELVWAEFSYWSLNYYPLFEPSINEARERNPVLWTCFEYLYNEVAQRELEQGGTDAEVGSNRLQDFLEGEAVLVGRPLDQAGTGDRSVGESQHQGAQEH